MSIRAYNQKGERMATANYIAKYNVFRQFYPEKRDFPDQTAWMRHCTEKDPHLTFSFLNEDDYLARQMQEKMALDPQHGRYWKNPEGRPLDQWAQEEAVALAVAPPPERQRPTEVMPIYVLDPSDNSVVRLNPATAQLYRDGVLYILS